MVESSMVIAHNEAHKDVVLPPVVWGETNKDGHLSQKHVLTCMTHLCLYPTIPKGFQFRFADSEQRHGHDRCHDNQYHNRISWSDLGDAH